MRRALLAAVALLTVLTGSAAPQAFDGFGLFRGYPEFRYSTDKMFRITCQDASVAIIVSGLDPLELSLWFASDRDVTINIDGDEAKFYLEDVYPTFHGWGIILRDLQWEGPSNWLGRIATANDVYLWTPLLEFSLVPYAESPQSLAAFAAACEDERFGRPPTQLDDDSIVLAPRPEEGERTALHEQDIGRSVVFRRTVLPTNVLWGFEDSPSGSILKATTAVPDRDLEVSVTIGRTEGVDERPKYFLSAEFAVGGDFFGGAITELCQVRVSPNEVGRRASAVRVGGYRLRRRRISMGGTRTQPVADRAHRVGATSVN